MATQSKSNKYVSSPLLASTHCSGFKSLYRTCRRHFSCSELSDHHLLTNPTISRRSMTLEEQTTTQQKSTPLSSCQTRTRSNGCIKDRRVAAKMYWERAHQLEIELTELDNWLSTEKKLSDSLHNCGRKYEFCASSEFMKLTTHGGYLHYLNVATLGRPCPENLVMQVSEPAMLLVETGSSFPQVLNRMALMGRENLIRWLLKSMPMNDISGMKIGARPIAPSSEEGFLGAIFLNAVENLKTLVLEGMEVQMGGRGKTRTEETRKKLNEETVGDCINEVMLIQIRDPKKEYEAIGEMMIGFVETSVTYREERGFLIKGVHVAGISAERSDQTGRGEYLWSISMRSSVSLCSSSSEKFVRNLDVYLPP